MEQAVLWTLLWFFFGTVGTWIGIVVTWGLFGAATVSRGASAWGWIVAGFLTLAATLTWAFSRLYFIVMGVIDIIQLAVK